MSTILIERHPKRLIREAAPQATHELAHVARTFAGIEGPINASINGIIRDKEIEPAASFLCPWQHQFLDGGVAATAIRFHGDRFHIKEQEPTLPRQLPPNSANSGQNCGSLRIITD
jgi:hypothetical protein